MEWLLCIEAQSIACPDLICMQVLLWNPASSITERWVLYEATRLLQRGIHVSLHLLVKESSIQWGFPCSNVWLGSLCGFPKRLACRGCPTCVILATVRSRNGLSTILAWGGGLLGIKSQLVLPGSKTRSNTQWVRDRKRGQREIVRNSNFSLSHT